MVWKVSSSSAFHRSQEVDVRSVVARMRQIGLTSDPFDSFLLAMTPVSDKAVHATSAEFFCPKHKEEPLACRSAPLVGGTSAEVEECSVESPTGRLGLQGDDDIDVEVQKTLQVRPDRESRLARL